MFSVAREWGVFISVIGALLIASCGAGVNPEIKMARRNPAYHTLFENYLRADHLKVPTYRALYLPVRSNLTCSFDIEQVHKWDDAAGKGREQLTFLTNRADSADVAIALKLEQFAAPLKIVDSALIKKLRWDIQPGLIIMFFDSRGSMYGIGM